jgi:hypothetical protein
MNLSILVRSRHLRIILLRRRSYCRPTRETPPPWRSHLACRACLAERCWKSSSYVAHLCLRKPADHSGRGVSIGPGLTTFTRMRRLFKSVVHVRANERTAAFVALYTLFMGSPLLPTMDPFRMMEAPSGRRGSAFCTVKSIPFTLMLKIES